LVSSDLAGYVMLYLVISVHVKLCNVWSRYIWLFEICLVRSVLYGSDNLGHDMSG